MATTECVTRIHQLDSKYQQGLHSIELINRDETDRRLSLNALTLRDANAALEDLTSQKELHILCLEADIEALKVELSETKLRSSRQESSSDLENLSSSREVLSNTLQDKAALTSELNSLRRELGQLESQLASHQAIVASNGDLRRQINTLEVDLENEKRLKLRAQQAEEKGVVSDLQSKLQQCEAKLNAERKEREFLIRELTDSHAETERQTERLRNIKAKLKESQSGLKDAQEDLQRSQRELSQIRKTSVNTVEEPRAKPPKTKQAQLRVEPQVVTTELSLDEVDMQSLPNEDLSEARQQRQRGTGHPAVGKKSNFSITPFLNKSRDATDYPDLDSDSSTSSLDSAANLKQSRSGKIRTSQEISPAKPQRPAARRRKPSTSRMKAGAMTEIALIKPLLAGPAASEASTMRKRTRLGEPTEALLVNNRKEDSDSEVASQRPKSRPDTSTAEGEETKEQGAEADGHKKRRKLLGGRGRTMFDDDEMEVNDNPSSLSRVARVKRGRSQLAGVSKAFTEPGNTFSPLKKERRGMNASFIG